MIWVDKIQEAINFIEDNLFEPINIDDVGKAINYSPSSFSNFFSAVTGYSVGEYIRFRRLSTAAERISNDDVSVTDMAFECGYDTVEAFSKAFKRFFGCSPSQFADSKSKYHFAPIIIKFSLKGGFSMKRNLIPGLQKVDWSDVQRGSEFVNSAVSALNGLGENTNYDYVCAVSGYAFMTSFSKEGWDFGNQSVRNAPIIYEHIFKMFGYKTSYYLKSDFEKDSRIIMDSIDRGMPVIANGVINCSNECLVSGYDNDGEVLLGYNPFMYIQDDHKEPHDDTGYFRKTNWHSNNFSSILIINDKSEKPEKEIIFAETLKLIKRLISDEDIVPDHYNGLAAHKAFANALMTYKWEDNFEPYMCVMCTYKMYLDRRYAVKFLEDNGRNDLARIYKEIAELCVKLGQIIPQDFSAGDMFSDKEKLKPYCDVLLKICDLEEKVLNLI